MPRHPDVGSLWDPMAPHGAPLYYCITGGAGPLRVPPVGPDAVHTDGRYGGCPPGPTEGIPSGSHGWQPIGLPLYYVIVKGGPPLGALMCGSPMGIHQADPCGIRVRPMDGLRPEGAPSSPL